MSIRHHEAHSSLSTCAVSDVDQIVKGDGVVKGNIGVERVEGVIETRDEVIRKDAATSWNVKAPVMLSVLPQSRVVPSGEISAESFRRKYEVQFYLVA